MDAARLDKLAIRIYATTAPGRLPDPITAGEALTEAKSILGHGAYLSWLNQRRFAFSRITAHRFIKVYQAFRPNVSRKDESPDRETFTPPLPPWAQGARYRITVSAFYALSHPTIPAEIRRAAIVRANMGLRVTVAWVASAQRTREMLRKRLTAQRPKKALPAGAAAIAAPAAPRTSPSSTARTAARPDPHRKAR